MSDDRYILDGKSFVDTKTNQCLNFGIKDLARVTITLNNMDMWLNQAEERIAELEEQIDYSFKINTWLIKKYGKEFWQDVGINENDDTITNLIKLDEIFDKVYEEMNKEMPKKWYEYGFGGKK